MDFSFPPDVEAFRAEVRSFLDEHLTEEMIEATHDGTIHAPELHAAMAAKGWLAGPVPEELGGGGRSALESVVLNEEMQLARAPIDAMAVAIIVAAILLEHGNDFLKETAVPRLLDGSALGCFGYTEPESGSDVAAATTR
ncbi:MAG: acyl-CoA dehydrogenase family protein, partial [Acidimicrobiales bacterium]|nr:acyl-CoA dehydrogenase family protein [Acidimicrobiales bacterium]